MSEYKRLSILDEVRKQTSTLSLKEQEQVIRYYTDFEYSLPQLVGMVKFNRDMK